MRPCLIQLALNIMLILPLFAADKGLTEVDIEDLMNIKVFSASKHLQDKDAAPAFVTIVTQQEIQRFGYRTLADVLQGVPGFYVTYDRNYSYLGVRGFGRPGDYNARVLLLINGHRMNDAIYDDALIGAEFPLDIDLIDHIEVVRGPGASLYGTSAFFAVINVITRSPERWATPFEASAEGRAFGGTKGRITYAGTAGGFDFMVSGSQYRSDGQTFFYREYQSPATNNGIAKGVDGEHSGNLFADVTRGHWRLTGLYGSREKTIPTGAFATDFDNPRNKTTDARAYADLAYVRDFGAWNIDWHIGYDAYGYSGRYVNPPDPSGISADYQDFARSDTLSGEFKISHPFGAKHNVTGGTELRYSPRLIQAAYYSDPFLQVVSDSHSSSVFAAYIEDEYSLTSRLSVQLGGRFDTYPTFGTAWSPRAAFKFKAQAHTDLKLIAGTAFRAPNSYELYYYPRTPDLPPLQPERIWTIEGIVEHRFGERVRFNASCYRTSIGKLLEEQSYGTTNDIMFVNRQRVSAKGADFEIEGNLERGIKIRAGYTALSVHDSVSLQSISNSPHMLANAGLSLPLGRFLVPSISGIFVGRRDTLSGASVPSYTRLDATIITHQVTQRVQLSATVYNLSNRRYWDPGNAEHLQDRLAQDGRAWRLKLTYGIGKK